MDFGRPPGDEIDPQAAAGPGQPPLQPSLLPRDWQAQAPRAQQAQGVMVPVPGAVAVEGTILVPAGFWPRFLAYIIDMIVLGILVKIFTMLAGVHEPDPEQVINAVNQFMRTFDMQALEGTGPPGWLTFLTYMIYGTYYTLFHAFNGATLGKMALGLQVRRQDGTPISFGQAFGRYICYWATGWLLYTAWFIAFDREKRTVYDALLRLNVFKAVAKIAD